MKNFIAELVKLYMQTQSLSEQEKSIKDEIKSSGGNPAVVSAVAKAIVNDKITELKERSEVTLNLIDLSRE